jgi:tetratricopeptide (TPR) repeat protein
MRSSATSLANAVVLSAAILLASGCAALDTGKMSAALQSSAPVESKLAFARLCERHGELDQAQTVYDGVLKQDPSNPQANHRLGIVKARQGDYQEAERLLTKAVELGEPDAELLSDLGYTYYLQDRLDEAEKLLRQAIEKSSTNHAAWTNLGLTLGQQGKFDESLAAFLRAGSPAEAHASLGYVLAQQNQFRRAQEEFRTALSLNPDLHSAAQGLLVVSGQIPGQQPVSVASTTARRKANPADAGMKKDNDAAGQDLVRVANTTSSSQSNQTGQSNTNGKSNQNPSGSQEANPSANPFSWISDGTTGFTPGRESNFPVSSSASSSRPNTASSNTASPSTMPSEPD